MGISITDDIKSITDLKRNTNQILHQVHTTGRPVVLTVNGKAEAVLLGAIEYEKMTNAIAMLKLLVPAENDVKAGNVTSAEAFFKEFRRDKKYKVTLTRHAQRDIEAIWDYISQDNPLNAISFITALEEQILSLATFPERNPVIPEGAILQTVDYRHLVYKNYRIVYRIEGKNVFVLRVFHGAKLLDIAGGE